MYKYARTKNRVHRVHVEGGRAFKVEQCNLDDAAYFGLDDEPAAIQHCAYCWVPADVEKQVEKEAATVPAVTKRELPKSLVLLPRRLFVVLVGLLALLMLLTGNVSGVVLSPDLASPSPTFDWQGYIDDIIAERFAEHLEFDHITDHEHEEMEPSSAATSLPTMLSPSPSFLPSPSPKPRTTSPIGTPRPTPRSTPRPTPMATPAPTASPSATPCFRPGNPQSGNDPCQWPPDDK